MFQHPGKAITVYVCMVASGSTHANFIFIYGYYINKRAHDHKYRSWNKTYSSLTFMGLNKNNFLCYLPDKAKYNNWVIFVNVF